MKTDKLRFYSQQLFSNLLPKQIYQQRLLSELEHIILYQRDEIEQRVNYYLKSQASFRLDAAHSCKTDQFKLKKQQKRLLL